MGIGITILCFFVGSILFAIFCRLAPGDKHNVASTILILVWLLILSFIAAPANIQGEREGYERGYEAGQVDALNGVVKYKKVEIPATHVWEKVNQSNGKQNN